LRAAACVTGERGGGARGALTWKRDAANSGRRKKKSIYVLGEKFLLLNIRKGETKQRILSPRRHRIGEKRDRSVGDFSSSEKRKGPIEGGKSPKKKLSPGRTKQLLRL